MLGQSIGVSAHTNPEGVVWGCAMHKQWHAGGASGQGSEQAMILATMALALGMAPPPTTTTAGL